MRWRLAIIGLLIATGAWAQALPAFRGALGPITIHDNPRALPELTFRGAGDRPLTIADFRGRVVLLNFWATWCAPCVEEMPSLERLQAAVGGADFEVVAISIDRQGARLVEAFFARLGIARLAMYLDPSGASARVLNLPGLPTTLLIDREGREVGRLPGNASWDTPAAQALIRALIERQPRPAPPPAAPTTST